MQDSLATSVNPTVLVFDSGLGGLTVLREISALRRNLKLVYAADDAVFPYGRLEDDALIARVSSVMDELIARYRPALAVIACNTASTLTLPVLRAKHAIPFVGTVPAIKPACAQSKTKRISVLATPGTVKRDYTRALIEEFASDCVVDLVGSPWLAPLAEAHLRGEGATDEEIAKEIAPAFRDDGAKTDTVVLACTHYPLLLERFKALAPWPVAWIDPAAAIARRVASLLPPQGQPAKGPVSAYFTSGKAPGPALAAALQSFGIEPVTAI
ncbi:MAG: glutamate racemase [Xanthobacteraceae bacterium]|nr:glutamate racemase [Xanthobacteraceae bacterium]